jgi:hypothetical protein
MALLWPLWQDGDMPSDGHGDRGPSLADLAPIVRQERLRRGLSAEQAGKLGGISKAGWQHIEAGTAKRYDHWRMAVAKAFGELAGQPARPARGRRGQGPAGRGADVGPAADVDARRRSRCTSIRDCRTSWCSRSSSACNPAITCQASLTSSEAIARPYREGVAFNAPPPLEWCPRRHDLSSPRGNTGASVGAHVLAVTWLAVASSTTDRSCRPLPGRPSRTHGCTCRASSSACYARHVSRRWRCRPRNG